MVETFVDLIRTGDLLEIRPHDLVPVDAVVEQGDSKLDESILTGESRPVMKCVGDSVLAGTSNGGSRLIVRATATGRETRLSSIVDLVEQASLEKPRIVQWANRVGGYFVGVVVVLAVATFAWWCSTDVSAAVERTVALLIVACPCALAIATPLAISVAIGRAARNKIIVKSGDVLQFLNRPGMLWLDKTGTVTTGQLEVVDWHGKTVDLPEIAALERDSSHPVAQAITAFATRLSDESGAGGGSGGHEAIGRESIGGVDESPGMGVTGQVGGRHFAVGSEALIRHQGVEITEDWSGIAENILAAGLSPCWIASDSAVTAMAAIGDSIRPEAGLAITELAARGWRVGMLSGDHERIVSQVAGRLGIDSQYVHGAVIPETKLKYVQQSLERFETVVMVGDGVNDSAALAAASVGIAVHNGAEASLAAAPVYLANEGLNPILELFAISESTGRTMRRNLAVSLVYNILGATLAFAGWINPLVAAIVMPASSLTVVALSLTAGASRRSTVGKGK